MAKRPIISDDITCPYCGYTYQPESCDCSETPQIEECDECGREFLRWASISVDYYTRAIEDGQPTEEKARG